MGRNKSQRTISDETLVKALNEVAYEKGKTNDGTMYFLKHYVRRAFASDDVLKSLAKKMVADVVKQEGAIVDQSVKYNIEVTKVDGSKHKISTTRKPVDGMHG